MARLEAIAKALYYPTPLRVVEKIADAISFSGERGSLLDPCAGQGEAAAYLGQRWGFKTYGIELHEDRARIAAKNLDVCLQGSYHQMVAKNADSAVGEQTFSVLFLNPPYDEGADEDGRRIRQEVIFLQEMQRYIAHCGILIYVVPRKILTNEKFLQTFTRHFRQGHVWAFPDPEVRDFDQVVVVGRRHSDGGYTYGATHAFEKDPLPVLGETEPVHFGWLPEVEPKRFRVSGTNPLDIAPSWEGLTGAYASQRWEALTSDAATNADAPLMSPRPGHQAMLLAAGHLNGLELDGCLIKGGSEKVTTEIEGEGTITLRESIVSHLSRLDLTTGELDTWRVNDNPEKTQEWFEKYGDDLGEAILKSHVPAFDGNYSEYDFSGLQAPGVLPGRVDPEILPIQKEYAAAINHGWRTRKTVILSGEMGVGKTTTAVVSCELAKHDKVVVVCPSHLVSKWIREAETITGIKGIAVTAKKASEIHAFFESGPSRRRPAPELLKPLTAGANEERVKAILADLESIEVKQPKPRGVLAFFGKRKPAPRKSRQAIAPRYLILSKEMAKLGSRWEPVYTTRKVTITREYGGGFDSWGRAIPVQEVASTVETVICHSCGAPQIEDDCRIYAEEFEKRKRQRRCTACASPMWTYKPLNEKGTKRWPLAKIINAKYARRFALVIDEAHQYSKAETDQSRAVQLLATAATKILPMTGTLYGGRASSIFHLLFKTEPGFRELYKYNECAKFVEHQGLFERVYTEDEWSSTYGYRKGRSGGRIREIPGMNPAMVATLLPYTLFLKLRDLQMDLPPYSEEVHLVDHDPDVEREAQQLASSVRDALRKHPQVLGQYLQACLGYPDRPDQREDIIAPETDESPEVHLGSARAFPDQLWPKDLEVIRIAKQEKRAGRKSLVFFSQTHRRDARARVRKGLEDAGLRVVVLDSNVSPEKREAWLRDAEKKGFEVMLTNGRLVETGMDLLFANTIIQYGIEYSVHSLRQSIRRSWRLGQTKPVRVIFMAYRSLMQETAIDLIARKMRAAEMVDGDEAGGLAQHDVGGSNFLVELAHEVIARGPTPIMRRRSA